MHKRLLTAVLSALMLAACAAPGAITPETPAPTAASGETPAPTVVESSPTPRLNPSATPIPKIAPEIAAADLLLVVWNEAQQQSTLRRVSAPTGEDVPGHTPIVLGHNFWRAPSPDGKTLAAITFPGQNSPRGGRLRLIDVQTWTDTETSVEVNQWPMALAFNADGSQLAVGASESLDHTLILFDLASQTAAQTSLDFSPQLLEFTPDGAALMVYGAYTKFANGLNPEARVALFDAADLSQQWQMPLTGIVDGQYAPEDLGEQALHDQSVWWRPGLAFAPERRTLYLVHADADKLTTVDFAQRTASTVAVGPARSWLDRLIALTAEEAYAKELNGTSKRAVLSADGQRLYVVGRTMASTQDAYGNWTFDETPLGLKVIEATSGTEMATLSSQATEIAWASDGRHLYCRAGAATTRGRRSWTRSGSRSRHTWPGNISWPHGKAMARRSRSRPATTAAPPPWWRWWRWTRGRWSPIGP